MGALATCKFPLLDRWKALVDSNKILGFIDAMLCGFGQIIFSDNSFAGAVLLAACFVVSPQVGVAAVWSAFVSVLFQYLFKAPALPLRLGVHTFTPILSGVIVSGLIFTEGMDLRFFVFFAMSAIFCTITSLGLFAVFGKWNAAPLGLPFGLTALIFMAAAQNMGFVSQAETVMAHSPSNLLPADIAAWNGGQILQATYAGISELLGGTAWIVAAMIGVALLMSSRIDFISAIVGSLVAALTAIYFGVPNVPILIGLYGYNGMLLMWVLNGRAFAITVRNFILCVILAGMTSILAAWMSISFGLVGAVCTAFPFSIICCLLMLAAPNTDMEYNPPMYWGVPETIPAIKAAALEAEEEEKAA